VKDNEANGHGKTTWKNGDWYEGRYANSQMKGEAQGKLHIGNSVYEGPLRDGKPDGRGKARKESDGKGKTNKEYSMYEGHFKAGKRHGFGTKLYKDGD
jgi:hypothetical protein